MGFPTGQVPQRSPAGISTSAPGFLFGDYPGPTPFRVHERFEDFDHYLATDWTVTTTNAGTAALANGNGGLLLLTTAATGADLEAVQTPVLDYNVIAGCRMWYAINFQTNDATATLIQAGFGNTFAALAPTDGIYFEKPAAATLLNLVLNKGGVKTTLAIGNIVAATQYTIGFYYDGKPTPNLYAFSTIGLAVPTAFAQPYYTGGSQAVISASADGANPNPLTNLPLAATGLVAGFAIKASAAAAKTLTVDYFYAGNEILRF